MWWSNSIALVLMSLLFCTWMWIVQLPHINSQDVITTNVEVSLIGETGMNNLSSKNAYKIKEDSRLRKKNHLSIPRIMLDLYEQATATRQNDLEDGRFLPDVVKGLTPKTTASILGPELNIMKTSRERRHLLMFEIPSSSTGETLQSAELRLLMTIVQQYSSNTTYGITSGVERLVHLFLLEKSRMFELGMQHVIQKHSDTWLSFNVTSAMRQSKARSILRLMVLIRIVSKSGQLDLALALHEDVQPLLLLSYSTPRSEITSPTILRDKRDAEDYEEESNNVWDDDRSPVETVTQIRRNRKQRNTCRRRPLYVDFAEIHYDTWIVAPNGYEAFQCTGKCFFPVSEHLSPTKHAIVQTLLHSIAPGKAPRACCVPTRLEPISVLYVDQRGVLTYRFSYQDMVVAECGCR